MRNPNQTSAVSRPNRGVGSVRVWTIHHGGRTPIVAAVIGQRVDRGLLPDEGFRDEFTMAHPFDRSMVRMGHACRPARGSPRRRRTTLMLPQRTPWIIRIPVPTSK